MLRQFRLCAVLLLVLPAWSGCGIKGPLVLPPATTTTAPATATPAATTTPVPAVTVTPAPTEKKP